MMKKVILICLVVFVASCGSDNNNTDLPNDSYNRKSMLTFWADEIIIPAYNDLSDKSATMNTAIENFATTPTTENLTAARTAWKKAYISWQKASLFQIGKAQELNLIANMNTYPTNVTKIEEYANAGSYNFESPNLITVQGFPALDYLLYGVGTTESAVVTFYSNDSEYVTYLKDVSKRIEMLASEVAADWNAAYKTSFIENDGNTTTSSVDKVVNFYVIPFFEKQLRENKIVTPAGARTGTALPDRAEGYYAKNISKELYTTTLQATINFFNGTAYNGTTKGQSLQQYLEFLQRDDLVKLINAKFDNVSQLTPSLENDFSAQVQDTEKRKVLLAVYDALQSVLQSFKPDMMSAMNITNTSTDTDND